MNQRLPLNRKCKFDKDQILYGYLQPVDPTKAKPILIRIRAFDHWSIDRSPTLRGIWVQSNGPQKAWYWLRTPCSIHPQVYLTVPGAEDDRPMTSSLPSMKDVNLLIRALFGLVSNLADVFSVSTERTYMDVYVKRKPADLFTMLSSPNDEFYREHSPNGIYPKNPFDLELLESYPEFCRLHLISFHTQLTPQSGFIQGLDELIQKKKSRTKWTPEKLIASAELAEHRSKRNSWGGLYAVPNVIKPNWILEAFVQNTLRLSQEGAVAEPSHSDEDASVEQPPPKEARHHIELLEDDSDEEPEFTPEPKPKPKYHKKVIQRRPTYVEVTGISKFKNQKKRVRSDQGRGEKNATVIVKPSDRKRQQIFSSNETGLNQEVTPKTMNNMALSNDHHKLPLGKPNAQVFLQKDDAERVASGDESEHIENQVDYSEQRMKEALVSFHFTWILSILDESSSLNNVLFSSYP